MSIQESAADHDRSPGNCERPKMSWGSPPRGQTQVISSLCVTGPLFHVSSGCCASQNDEHEARSSALQFQICGRVPRELVLSSGSVMTLVYGETENFVRHPLQENTVQLPLRD